MPLTIHLNNHFNVEVLSHNLIVSQKNKQIYFALSDQYAEELDERFQLAKVVSPIEHQANILGDGFQMLAQTGGTAERPIDIGRCPDNNLSYRIYDIDSPKRFYNYLVIEQSNGFTLYGFTSCRSFAGYFEIDKLGQDASVTAHIDGESVKAQDRTDKQLESLCVLHGDTLEAVYQEYCILINQNHQPRFGITKAAPVGWCSWYAYYADVSEMDIRNNLKSMQGPLNDVEWVLLDDGYQAFMGDWLTPSDKFSNGVKELIADIKSHGKKPAIWLAPFIAQPESDLFQNHPDWFVRSFDGELLKAEDVTYGGWRCTPWYILDTSHPEVQQHLEHVVKTMREEWGVELFKLDANYWGTLKGSRFIKGVTGVEAYRLGMQAIARGAGDGWLLGCNAPMWPSLGAVDAMRVSDDVERRPERFEQIAKETFYRSWQHRKLWQIDPDCVTLTSLANQATDRHSYEFHRDAILASAGLLLSGDPLPDMTKFALDTFNKLIERQKLNQQSTSFKSLSLNHAHLKLDEHSQLDCLFNFDTEAKEFTLTNEKPVHWYDYWSGNKLTTEPSSWLEVTISAGLSSKVILSKS
ncbi:alpha-galactosidase [Vibrio makurazakiensis]|uniref:glycoside hydrolase family 36 protein n=1 Tax=Vibrio makurazakiensis TaxID=2910250 RepID=UPI003D0BD097